MMNDNHPNSMSPLKKSAQALAEAARNHAEVARTFGLTSEIEHAEEIAEHYEKTIKQYL
jgi:hypothetical protein